MSILRAIIKRKREDLPRETIIRKVKKLLNIGLKKYKDTELFYKSDEEFLFLEKYYDKLKLENADRIQYVYKGRKRFYYPDFYYAPMNLIIEIKEPRNYWDNKEKNDYKKDACLNQGFTYILILSPNYDNFNELMKL